MHGPDNVKYQMLIGHPGEKRMFGRTRRRRFDDTKIDLK